MIIMIYNVNNKNKGKGKKRNIIYVYKGNNKITELRTILQRESQNLYYTMYTFIS
jgi:hypothetical protein